MAVTFFSTLDDDSCSSYDSVSACDLDVGDTPAITDTDDDTFHVQQFCFCWNIIFERSDYYLREIRLLFRHWMILLVIIMIMLRLL